jgi:hypothetical protein
MTNDNTDQNDKPLDEQKPKDLSKNKALAAEESDNEIRNKDAVKYRRYSRRGLIITASVLGLIAIGLVVAAIGVVMHNNNASRYRDGNFGMMGNSLRFESRGSNMGYGRYVQTNVSNDSVTTTVYNYQTGVVTAVNSDNIVIAGNGKSTTIKTNSSTQYPNSVKPSVNDTVTITGTTTDNAVTATEINVVNQ